MNVETTHALPVKATFLQTTIRFDLPSRNFSSLHEELSKRLPGFEYVNYIDDEGDAVRMNTDEELDHAVNLSNVSGVLRLVLTPPHRKYYVVRKPETKIRKWLERKAPEHFVEWEEKLLSLHELGFPCCRRNFKVLQAQEGDLQKTFEILKTEQVKKDERQKHREIKKLKKHGVKRKHDNEHKQRKQRCGEKRKKDRSCEPSSAEISPLPSTDFLALANQAFVGLAVDALPGKFTHLFVDGNNMLYLTNKLREFTLQRKINVSQKILASVTRHFSTLHLFNTELVFDSMNSTAGLTEIEHLENGSSFCVTSAHPEFTTSDAKFVAWARAHPDLAPNTLVVTSDRALAGELFSLGVSVVKPGVWLACLAASSSNAGIEGQSLDWKEWLDAWIERRTIDE